MAENRPLTLNIEHGETVHQRCLLLTGKYLHTGGKNLIEITTTGANSIEAFPKQIWPAAGGYFKALVMLLPGVNQLTVSHLRDGNSEATVVVAVYYIPLLQTPPLHLVIVVASDSPLTMYCPSHKSADAHGTHDDLAAAVAKLRMTAYMWQAMTAEDMRLQGLGRRTFRLEEEEATDSVSRTFYNTPGQPRNREGITRTTAKVRIMRSSATTSQIRQDSKGNLPWHIFIDALKEAKGPFEPSNRPVVAGLMLDFQCNDRRLDRGTLGRHNPDGISFGLSGSDLTYSWPRFVEEVAECLTNTSHPGYRISKTYHQKCASMWEACAFSQQALLKAVGVAFGVSCQHDIVGLSYAPHWPRNFLAETAYACTVKSSGVIVSDSTQNSSCWDLVSALALWRLGYFRLPSDSPDAAFDRNEKPKFRWKRQEHTGRAVLEISSSGGLARVSFHKKAEEWPTPVHRVTHIEIEEEGLHKRFNRTFPLSLSILGLNGQETSVENLWQSAGLHTTSEFIKIPGSGLMLQKRSMPTRGRADWNDLKPWVQLLRNRGADGRIHRAVRVEFYIGSHFWKGARVKYRDGHTSEWGMPRRLPEGDPRMRKRIHGIDLPGNVPITKIECKCDRIYAESLISIKLHLADGTSSGPLRGTPEGPHETADDRSEFVMELAPPADEVIVGLFGKTDQTCHAVQFGIITAPKTLGLDGLPDAVFDLPELRSNPVE